MPVTTYKLWANAPSRRKDDARHAEYYDVGIHSLAKKSLENPYENANEMIALRLGQTIGLPIPPGAVVDLNGDDCFCSMVFGSGHELPPADTPRLAREAAPVATGIVVFDCWICNLDRHERNLHYDEVSQQVTLIDHGRSLFGGEGVARLDRLSGQLGVSWDDHSVALELQSFIAFDEWLERILDLPHWLIRESVFDSRAFGIEVVEAEALTEFLLHRRAQIRTMFFQSQADKSVFPEIRGVFRIKPESSSDGYPEYSI